MFGAGYYGWPLTTGLCALWLSVAAAGWLARYAASLSGRDTFSIDDLGRVLGIVDRAATRLPALGIYAERARITYLIRQDGLARLLQQSSLPANTR